MGPGRGLVQLPARFRLMRVAMFVSQADVARKAAGSG